jgi:CHAT domain-containing protein/tetratricopeptide (TPR) repeat protein
MSQATCLLSLVLLLSVTGSIFCSVTSASLGAGQKPSPDEARMRVEVSQYFDSFAKKDLDDLLKHWSAGSPELEARRKELQQEFAANEHFEVKNLAIRKLTLEGDKASAQVTLEITATDIKTSQPATAFGKMNRVLEFVKESGFWKIAREGSAEEDLAAALIAAKTDERRDTLLSQNHELVNSRLIGALKQLGDRSTDYREQLRIYVLAEKLAEKIGDKHRTAEMLNSVAAMHRMLGDYPSAIDFAHKSLTISEETGDQMGIANSLLALGVLSYSQGSNTTALEYYRKSLALSKSLDDKQGIALALSGLAQVAEELGDYAEALDSYNKSLGLRSELGDKAKVALGLNAIGVIYFRQGNYAQALEYARKSMAMSEEANSTQGVAQALSTIASVYRERGEYPQALDSYQQSLKIREGLGEKRGIGNPLNNIGLTYYLQGRYDQALEYLARALSLREAIGDKLGIAQSLNSIAHVHQDRGDYAKAIEFAQRASAIAREIGNRETLWNAQTVVGKSYGALNQPGPAEEALAEAIATIEALRFRVAGSERDQEQFFENKVAPYQEMARLLLSRNSPSEALNYLERARARVLLDVLRGGRANATKAMSADERRREEELRAALTTLNAQLTREKTRPQPDKSHLMDLEARLEKARLERENFEVSLYAAHPELKTLRGESAPLKIEQASELVSDERTALLVYAVANEQIYLFVVTKAVGTSGVDLKSYTLPIKRNQLAAKVERFRQRLANRDLDYTESGTDGYNLLIKPAQEQLRGKSTLVIVPYDVLWDLPFQALQPADGHYLVEGYAISYAPSLTVLREMIARRDRRTVAALSLLAVGNPFLGKQTIERARMVLMNEALEPLPEAERQAKMLGQLYGPKSSKVYVGAEAREDRVKSEGGRYRILQLATHGILNNTNPMYSHIVLSLSTGDAKEDGLLEAWEIMNLDLKADLVVLSACDTARGRIGAGEGVIGLTWAIFVAGSPTTVVSQWSVDSSSTTELMLNFHRNLKAPGGGSQYAMSKAEALRQAQLKLLRTKRYQHPFFWAGFVVVGDGG